MARGIKIPERIKRLKKRDPEEYNKLKEAYTKHYKYYREYGIPPEVVQVYVTYELLWSGSSITPSMGGFWKDIHSKLMEDLNNLITE